MSDYLVIYSSNKNPFNNGESFTKIKKEKTKTKNTKIYQEIKYPKFQEMANLCSDSFWKTTFIDASYGKFHRGFKYDKEINSLSYKLRNKIFTCNISNLTAKDSITVIQDFMRTTANIMSTEDIKNKTEKIIKNRTFNVENSIDCWSKIKSPIYKQILVYNFINENTKKYNLSQEESKQFEYVIRLGIFLKYLNSNNIHVEDGKITQIDGIKHDKNGYHLDIPDNFYKNKPIKDNIPNSHSNNLSKKWSYFLDCINKKEKTKSSSLSYSDV